MGLLADKEELQHRGIEILKNISQQVDLAKWLIERGLLEPVTILTYSQYPPVQAAATICLENLKSAQEQ